MARLDIAESHLTSIFRNVPGFTSVNSAALWDKDIVWRIGAAAYTANQFLTRVI